MSFFIEDQTDPLLRHAPRAAHHTRGSSVDRNATGLGRFVDAYTYRPGLRRGWVNIYGFKLPWRLALLFLLPPTVILLSLLTNSPRHPRLSAELLSNGTHLFHPTTMVISIDGFRPDYLEKYGNLLPNLRALGEQGVRAKSMQPVFPSLTFPNHWSLMTGLYPESHGIVANDFYAPDLDASFSYSAPNSLQGAWWGGEPMWSVAERGGRRSANVMWPGPARTKEGIAPSIFVQFRALSPQDKLPILLHYFDMPVHTAPSLILGYLPDVDKAGHQGGPESQDVSDALARVDKFVGSLGDALVTRNLTDIVNLVIVSDHGMAPTSAERVIFLDDILGDGFKDIEYRDGWPSLGLRFKDDAPVDSHLKTLERAANDSFAVYTHETMPERFHFNSGERVAPIYLVPQLGWVITDHHDYDLHNHNGVLDPKGCHGFDNMDAEMQAIFFATGPFVERMKTKAGSSDGQGWSSLSPPILNPFPNLQLFPLVMRLLGLESITPPHNGSLSFWDTYL